MAVKVSIKAQSTAPGTPTLVRVVEVNASTLAIVQGGVDALIQSASDFQEYVIADDSSLMVIAPKWPADGAVVQPQAISLIATPSTTLGSGSPSVLEWASIGGVSATLRAGSAPAQNVPLFGSLQVTPTETVQYLLTVVGAEGTTPATRSTTVNVPAAEAPPAPVINSFTISSGAVDAGNIVSLDYDTTNVTSAVITASDGSEPYSGGPSGTVYRYPSVPLTWTLTVTGPGGTAQAQVSVSINAEGPPEGDVLMTLAGPQVTVQSTGRAVQTAAGVYAADGRLLRTLWRRVLLGANASHVATWNYQDDLGNTVADGAYKVRVIAHNVGYKWEGVIGNNTNPGFNGITQRNYNFGGQTFSMPVVSNFYRAFCSLSDMKFGPNGVGFCCNGYNEQQNAMFATTVSGVKQRTIIGHDDFLRVFQLVATDGVRGYFANTGSFGEGIFNAPVNFVVAFQPNGAEVSFASGSAWTTGLGPGNYWNSCIDVVSDGVDQIQGIAVEPSGTNLYVAHKNTGIKVFNKTTGAFVRSYSVPNPSMLALAPSGDLYAIVNGGTEVRRYANPASATTHNQAITGFTKATAIGVSPVTSTVVVVDSADTQQRLKAYNAAGAAVWQHGAAGGYTDGNPNLSTNKFNFKDNESPHNYVAFEPAAGSQEFFWMGEPGNHRSLRFEIPSGASGTNPLTYRDQIAYLIRSYRSAVDKADPTRVFSDWKEYSVNYSQELTQSWTFVRNWGVGLSDAFRLGFGAGIEDCITYPGGRTYAICTSSSGRRFYELTANALRDTGITVADGDRLAEDGSLRSTLDASNLYQVRQKSFTGLDGSGNPQFGAAATVATGPKLDSRGKKNPYAFGGSIRQSHPKTSTGLYVTFNPNSSLDGTGDGDPALFHLGALAAGTNADFRFRASPAGSFTFSGSLIVNGDGTFNTADMQQPGYGGSIAMASGRHVVYNYFGEFWNNGQAGQWMHWLDNGLFLGQFGVPTYPSNNKGDSAIVGSIGNSFSGSMVGVGSDVYIYSNDESVHAGVHRYKLTGLDNIQEMVGNVGRNTAVTNPSSIPSVNITP